MSTITKANIFYHFFFTSKQEIVKKILKQLFLFHRHFFLLSSSSQIRIQILIQFLSSRSLLFFSLRSAAFLTAILVIARVTISSSSPISFIGASSSVPDRSPSISNRLSNHSRNKFITNNLNFHRSTI